MLYLQRSQYIPEQQEFRQKARVIFQLRSVSKKRTGREPVEADIYFINRYFSILIGKNKVYLCID